MEGRTREGDGGDGMKDDSTEWLDANPEFASVRPKGPDYWILKPGDVVEVVSVKTLKPLAIAMYTDGDTVADPHDIYGRNVWLRWIFLVGKAKVGRAWRRTRTHEEQSYDCNLIGQLPMMHDFTAKKLMDYQFDSIPVRELIRSGRCNERCLLAEDPFHSPVVCDCRCGGRYHAALCNAEVRQ